MFQNVAGFDYERQLWPGPPSCEKPLLTESLPGFGAETLPCPVAEPSLLPAGLSTSVKLDYQNLIERSGEPAFAHAGAVSALNLRFNPIPKLDVRSSIERAVWKRNIGDTSVRVDLDGSTWEVHNSLAVPIASWFTPTLGAGWNWGGGWEYGLGLKGEEDRSGLSWALAVGYQEIIYPMAVKLENYAPITVPFELQKNYQALSLGWRLKRFALTWTGRHQTPSHPSNPENLYTLSDSGESFKQIANLSLAFSHGEKNYRLALEGEYNSGGHVFRGIRNKNGLYQFGYEETENRDDAFRADFQVGSDSWEFGTYAAASALEWNALRPEVSSGKYFWDRNGVLDSYQGGVLGIFDRETWLFDGNIHLRQWTFGTWLSRNFRRGSARLGLSYHQLDFKARGHYTKKTSTFVLAYTEEEGYPDFPGLEAGLLVPELRLSRRVGRTFLEVSLGQAIPMQVQFHGGSDPGSSGGASSSYSGGTQASIKAGWGSF